MSKIFRTAGWMAVAGLIGAALISPAAVSANDLHQDPPIVGTDFGNQDCSDGLGTGWIFINTGSHDETGAVLTAKFAGAGTVTANGFTPGNGTVHYFVPVDTSDTLLSASDSLNTDGLLNLSHVCSGETTTTSSTTESTTSSETTDTSTTETKTSSSESTTDTTSTSSTTDTQSTSDTSSTSSTTDTQSTSDTSSTSSTTSSTTDGSTTSSTTSSTTTTGNTPNGSVEAETGTPHATPPATDAVSPTSGGPTNGTWQLMLIGAAALLASILILTPATATRRNKR